MSSQWTLYRMTIDSPELLMCCMFMIFCVFWDAEVLFGLILGASGPIWLTFEGLGLTLEAHGLTLRAFELQFSSPWGHLGSYWLDFGVSWMVKVVQNAPTIVSC